MSRNPIYTGGMDALLAHYEARRDALDYAQGESLATLDVDLAALAQQSVTDPAQDPVWAPPMRSSYHRKCFELRQELQGESELVFLHGLLVSHLRKRSFPDHAPALFVRLWREQGDYLLSHLNPRWLVSAVTTFGDHGDSAVQRATGLALTALFGMMKLYESERLYSGKTPDQVNGLHRVKADLPLEMDHYSITNGGLDVNLIARLWHEAADDPVMAPLVHHLLDMLIHDPANLFRRLQDMRAQKLAERQDKQPAKPKPSYGEQLPADRLRWGLVSTIKAPLPQIAQFAAHHLELGADSLHIYLDEPNQKTAAFLAQHPRIRVVQCDDAYWTSLGKPRPDTHQNRQGANASRTLQSKDNGLHWLGHIDVDEFILTAAPMSEVLSRVPSDKAALRLPVIEALAPKSGTPSHFKLPPGMVGQSKGVLQDIYPTFGMHLNAGFLSHTVGKIIGRTHIPKTRMNIHALRRNGARINDVARADGVYLAHFHTINWDQFRKHLDFRMTKGSYRTKRDGQDLSLGEMLRFVQDEEGETGLWLFYDEVCADTPRLRDRLAQHNMLKTHHFDLNAAVLRVFGKLP